MNEFLVSLATGALANIISDGVGAGAKYVLSTKKMDMELRKSVESIEKRQLNIEGTIQGLINNQDLLISLFTSIISEYHLQSRIYAENKNIILIVDPNDIILLDEYCITHKEDNVNSVDSKRNSAFSDYWKYVREKRGLN